VSVHYDSVGERLLSGPMHAYNILSYTVFTLKNLVGMSLQEKDISPVAGSVSGPVGIYSVIEGIFEYGGPKAYLGLLDLMGLMSVSLAVINLLPIPALDGGRLFFVVLEGIRGKKVLPGLEESLHRWGMLILLMVLVLVTARDLFRIFG
jgi:regulator of sigma E protease